MRWTCGSEALELPFNPNAESHRDLSSEERLRMIQDSQPDALASPSLPALCPMYRQARKRLEAFEAGNK
jgi:hypothetical protein